MEPHTEYIERLRARRAWAEQQQRLHIRAGNLRLLVFLIAAAIGWAAFARQFFSGWWLLIPVAGFIALLKYHAGVVRERDLAHRAIRYYERALARLEDRWAGTGEAGERYRDPAHPYSEDLDLFGKGSLFELLSTARTRSGEDTLARWLLQPAGAAVVVERQAAVAELRPLLDLREDLALLGEDLRGAVDPAALTGWAERPPAPAPAPATTRAAVAVLSIAFLAVGSYWLAGAPVVFRVALLVLLAINLTVRLLLRGQVANVGSVEEAARELSLLANILSRLERERFTSPRLVELRRKLEADGSPPSERIARLNRLMELFDSRDHELMRFVGPPLLYDTQLAFAIEAWRARSGGHVRAWLDAVGEFEALSALAGYGFERPGDPFPEVSAAESRFDAKGLGHPLLPEARCVRNDLALGGDARLLVVSGSNMSGKSTLLRSAGVAAVMALAGAPVRARALHIGALMVGASIRSTDSLQDGTSRFYAEITRLRKLVDLAGAGPLLFLIDELLNGTNSHDRQIGAEAVVRGLVDRGAVGLVTTHDLALTEIAAALAPRGANIHFEDHLKDGRLTFDYVMRPGVVRNSNALELMRSVGLDI